MIPIVSTSEIMASSSRTLILWRHAKSAWDNPELTDFERPLAPRGRNAAPQMADWICSRYQPALVICSPARRTAETASYLKKSEFTALYYDERIYEASAETLLTIVRAVEDKWQSVMLVGHNPGMEDLTEMLTAFRPQKFPTAACAVLQVESEWQGLAPETVELVAYQYPKALPTPGA